MGFFQMFVALSVVCERCLLIQYGSWVLTPNYLEFILTEWMLSKVNKDIKTYIKRLCHTL